MAEKKQSEHSDWAWSESGDVEVPINDWERFLDSFSSQHQGWLASLATVYGRHASMEALECRLQRISYDSSQIRVSLACGTGDRLEEFVKDPVRLVFKRNESGAHQGLDLTASDGSITTLRFRVAVRPETLDGVLAPART